MKANRRDAQSDPVRKKEVISPVEFEKVDWDAEYFDPFGEDL